MPELHMTDVTLFYFFWAQKTILSVAVC